MGETCCCPDFVFGTGDDLFSPAVFDGKVIMQGDNIKATGMGSSQMDQYAETAQPGEFSVWSDAMFGGMPYVTGYGQAAPSMPSYSIVDGWLKRWDMAMRLWYLSDWCVSTC